MKEYIDIYDRFHTKRIDSDADGLPTNNAYIYSFYAKMLGLYELLPGYSPDLPGLLYLDGFSRHPTGSKVPISHDEYVGVAGMSELHAKEIARLGTVETHWQFCDLPGFEPKPFYKLNPIRVAIDLYKVWREDNPRRATVNYPSIWNVAFWHRPEQQYFYVRCAGFEPTKFQSLYFFAASLFTIFFGSKSLMLGFKLMRLKQRGYTNSEKILALIYKQNENLIEELKKEITDLNCPIFKMAVTLGDGLNDKI